MYKNIITGKKSIENHCDIFLYIKISAFYTNRFFVSDTFFKSNANLWTNLHVRQQAWQLAFHSRGHWLMPPFRRISNSYILGPSMLIGLKEGLVVKDEIQINVY